MAPPATATVRSPKRRGEDESGASRFSHLGSIESKADEFAAVLRKISADAMASTPYEGNTDVKKLTQTTNQPGLGGNADGNSTSTTGEGGTGKAVSDSGSGGKGKGASGVGNADAGSSAAAEAKGWKLADAKAGSDKIQRGRTESRLRGQEAATNQSGTTAAQDGALSV